MTDILVSAEFALLAEAAKRKLSFYRPYPKQMKFHNASAEYHEILLMAANRVGKSLSAAAQTAMHATGLYPEWYTGRRFKYAPVIWCAGVSGAAVRDSIQKLLIGDIANPGTGFLPAGSYETVAARSVADLVDIITVKHVSGSKSRINLKMYEQGREKFQADSVDFCIAKDELVQLSDGRLIPIQDVRTGEYVFTIDNKGKRVSRKVLAIHEKGIKPIVEARLSRGPWLRLTSDHEIFEGVRVKKKVSDAYKVYQLPGDWEPNNTYDKDDAFYSWTGLILSEGYIKGRKITMGDCKAVESAINMLPKNARVRKKTFSNNHVPDWYLYWNDIWALFKNALSHEKHIPDFIFTSSNKKIALFLSYLFAGDGWASGHTVGYATTSRVMANQISCLLARFGIRSTINIKKPQRKEWRVQWWVMITSADHVLSFIKNIGIVGKDVAIEKLKKEAMRRINSKSSGSGHLKKDDKDRKWDTEWLKKRNKANKNRFSKITAIEDVGEEMVYDLSIEKNHSFCLGTSIVSNCWLDEEPDDDVYMEALTRTYANSGYLVMTFTPLKGGSKVVKRFTKEKSQHRCVINMTIDDALHISEDDRKRIIDSYDVHQQEARAYGRPVLGSGIIFPVMRRDISCDPFPMESVPFYWQELAGIDFGGSGEDGHPTAAVKLLYNTQDDIIYVTNTYRRKGGTTMVHAAALRPWGKVPFAWPHDGMVGDKGSGIPLKEQYRAEGLNMLSENARFEDGSNGVEAGIDILLQRFETGRLKIFSHLTDLFEEMDGYYRDEGKIIKLEDDLICALRYSAAMCLRFAQRVNLPRGAQNTSLVEEPQDSYNKPDWNPLVGKYLDEVLGIK